MSLVVYNTLSNKKEKFVPIEEGKVKLYLCGPTVYNYLHIGNFRGPITFNLMRNWMEKIGYEVTFVYNYTDVDDKIIQRANEEGVESKVISERYIDAFEEDFRRLGLKPHDYNPKVTDFIDNIISFVAELVEKEKAYVVDGEVFYEINKFEDYGKLSKNKLDDLNAGQRVEVDQKKRNPLDFVLWKPAKKGEPYWDSPWGKGRPGWHIECSAMIKSILGESIDIHGGGIDLIFPHHECEIAQGEGCSDKNYCNYWIHNNFINMDGEKMSKSLGNVTLARDFMDMYHPEILKYMFLSAHYRSVLSISDEKIIQTASSLSRIYNAILVAKETITMVEGDLVEDNGFSKKLEELSAKITRALNDDFNTAEFIASIFEAVRAFNALGFANKKKRNINHKGQSQTFIKWISQYSQMASLFNEEPRQMINALDEMMIKLKRIDLNIVNDLLAQRSKAREDKNWTKADDIRDELAAMNIEILDGHARGWRVKIQ
ncbi:MAG: cysteine--tRNA ligase [Bacteriovoracaceae bacterium]|jgi:cysteinyl-tRNA synthetase|nr:cysteine--tRNA ligase [Bacteriovoracaceae bacterium]